MTDNVEVARLRAAFEADTKNFEQGAKKVQGGLDSISKLARGVGSVLANMIPVALFAGAIKEAADSQQALAGLKAVLASTKGMAKVTERAALDLASALQKTTRFSDEQVVSVQSLLLGFTKIGKTTFPKATEMALDMATALGTDAAGAAKQLGAYLNAPIQAITKLQRVGITFTARQQQQIRYFTQTNQLAKAQGIILEALSTKYGGAAKAAGATFAGSIDRLKNSFSDLLETIGMAILPTLQKFLDIGMELLSGLQNIDPGLVSFAAALGLVAVAAGPIGAALGAILSPVGLLVGAIAGIKLAFDNNLGGIADFLKGVAASIGPALGEIGKTISEAFNAIFTTPAPQVAPVSFTQPAQMKNLDFGERLKNAVLTAIPKIQEGIGKVKEALVTALGITPEVEAAIGLFFSPLTQAFQNLQAVNWANIGIAGLAIGSLAVGFKGLGVALSLFKGMVIFELISVVLRQISEGVDAVKVGDVGSAIAHFAVGVGALGAAMAVTNIGTNLPLVTGALASVAKVSLGGIIAGLWGMAAPILAIAAVSAAFLGVINALNATPGGKQVLTGTGSAVGAVEELKGKVATGAPREFNPFGSALGSAAVAQETIVTVKGSPAVEKLGNNPVLDLEAGAKTRLGVPIEASPRLLEAVSKNVDLTPGAKDLLMRGITVRVTGIPGGRTTIEERDTGGPTKPNQPYQIGKPEMFNTGGRSYLIAPQAGNVTPLQKGGTGNVTNVYINGLTIEAINNYLRKKNLPTLTGA